MFAKLHSMSMYYTRILHKNLLLKLSKQTIFMLTEIGVAIYRLQWKENSQ